FPPSRAGRGARESKRRGRGPTKRSYKRQFYVSPSLRLLPPIEHYPPKQYNHRKPIGGVMASVTLRVNGRAQSLDTDDPAMPLLYALRDSLGLHGPKFGCGLGQCGACTVIIDGQAVRSCQVSVSSVQNKAITTLEGLGTPEKLSPVQAAFVAEQAAQCG